MICRLQRSQKSPKTNLLLQSKQVINSDGKSAKDTVSELCTRTHPILVVPNHFLMCGSQDYQLTA